MGYLFLALIVLGAVGTGAGYFKGERDGVASYQVKVAAAEKALADQQAKMKQEEQNHIDDMQTAFEAGEAKAKTITKTIYVKGQADVAKYPVFANPVCTLPDDSLRTLAAARARVALGFDSPGTADAVPAAAPAQGRQDGNALPAYAGGRGPGVAVHPQAGATTGDTRIPGTAGASHPRPTPQ